MASDFTFASYSIMTSSDKDGADVLGYAYCPVCGRTESAAGHGRGDKYAITLAVNKVTTHMQLAHGINDVGEQ